MKLNKMVFDDKKIEEAAFAYNDGELTNDKLIRAAFICSAKWTQEEFLKSLWHPNSEEPRKGAKFLYQNHYNSRFYYYIDKIDDILETYPNWSVYVKHVRVIRWLYIEDLFPKKGGE